MRAIRFKASTQFEGLDILGYKYLRWLLATTAHATDRVTLRTPTCDVGGGPEAQLRIVRVSPSGVKL